MNKTTKGAVAAAAAATVLLGGAGTLAYWSGTAQISAGSFTSGFLSLTAGTCDTSWVYAPGSGSATGTTVKNIVPGDAITKNCTFTIAAQGDHLSATPTVPANVTYKVTSTPAPVAANLSLPVTATYSIGGTAFTSASTITEANNGNTLTAAIVVKFPYGSATLNGNDTQKLAVTLDALTVSLQQTAGATNPN